MKAYDMPLCPSCGGECGWSKQDNAIVFRRDGRPVILTERSLDCGDCGRSFCGGVFFTRTGSEPLEVPTFAQTYTERGLVVPADPEDGTRPLVLTEEDNDG